MQCFLQGTGMVLQERFSFTFVFPEIVKTINFELCGITRAAEQNVLRLFQPRFQLLLLSLPHRSSCTQPLTQLHPHTSAHFINKTWVSQALSQGADPSHSFREEVKQTCRRAKRADPSQNAIIMPIFWEGHQGFGENRGTSGFQKRFE